MWWACRWRSSTASCANSVGRPNKPEKNLAAPRPPGNRELDKRRAGRRLLLFLARLIRGLVVGALHAFLEAADALAEPARKVRNATPAEKHEHDGQDQQKLGKP